MKNIFGYIALALTLVLVSGCDLKHSLFNWAMSAEQSLASLQKHSIEVDGHRIVYLERKADQPNAKTLLLIHGFSADKSNWPRFVRHIPEKYRVIVPDLPAHGESSYLENASYSITAQADRLRALMEKLGIEKAHLVGNSMGGAIIATFAVRYPPHALSLTLIDAAGVDDPNTQSDLEKALEQGENPLLVKTRADFANTLAFAMADPPFMPWPIKDVLAELAVERQPRFDRIFKQIHADVTPDDPGYLKDITCPTLILWGRQDRLLHVSNAEQFVRYIPNARVIIYEDLGHMPMLEAPARSARDVVNFIEAIKPVQEPAS